jgi:hypothetical protein
VRKSAKAGRVVIRLRPRDIIYLPASRLRDGICFQLAQPEPVRITAGAVELEQIDSPRGVGNYVRSVIVGTEADDVPNAALRAFHAMANSAEHDRLLWKGPCWKDGTSVAQSTWWGNLGRAAVCEAHRALFTTAI